MPFLLDDNHDAKLVPQKASAQSTMNGISVFIHSLLKFSREGFCEKKCMLDNRNQRVMLLKALQLAYYSDAHVEEKRVCLSKKNEIKN